MPSKSVVELTKSGVWVTHPGVTAQAFMAAIVVTERPRAFRAMYRTYYEYASLSMWNEARETADQMRELSSHLNDNRGRKTAYLLGGLARAVQKDYEKAAECFGRAYSLETYHDPSLWHNVLGYVAHGIVNVKQNQGLPAIVQFQLAHDALTDLEGRMCRRYNRPSLCGGLCAPSRDGLQTIPLPPMEVSTHDALRSAIEQAIDALA